MRVDDFIEATNTAATPEEVFGHYERVLGAIGMDRIMYSALTSHSTYDSIAAPSVMRNYPEDWIKHYVARGYIQKDPVRTHTICSRVPYTWKEMMETVSLTKEERCVMEEGEEAGLFDGAAVPLHGPFGEVMGVGMASSVGGIDTKVHLARIHAYTVQFHTAFTALTQPNSLKNNLVSLTPREREVLQWCATGKSNWTIGEILNISEHGVEFHIRNILTKMNADSRLTAVVKALRNGIITY